MTIYLGLGSNDGDRTRNLERAIGGLVSAGFRVARVSPVVESPALLPAGADPAWHKPYLNLVLSGDADWQPPEGLAIAKRIERELLRSPGPRWSPRPIDIDLLRWHHRESADGDLTLPHADARRRDFVLTPLLHLRPDLAVGRRGESVFALTHAIRPIPLWMAAINLTPDSFSDGGAWRCQSELGAHFDHLIAGRVHIIDLGAESTRPAATALTAAQEWTRLEPALAALAERLRGRHIKPWLSVDSRHPANLDKALRYGLDLINDVTGLTDPDMLALARDSGCQVVAMHSVSVPAGGARLPETPGAVRQLTDWTARRLEAWSAAGLDLNRIITDPGIGFGKTAIQSFDLLAHCHELRAAGLRLLVGHSRKSFMAGLTDHPPAERDLETLGVSLALCQQGVDIIRVHSPVMHMRAYLAWAHVEAARQAALGDADAEDAAAA